MSILSDISATLQRGRAPKVKELVQQALNEGIAAVDILEQGLLDGMGIIGTKFKNNEVFVPEVLVAARAMNAGIEILKPFLTASGNKSKGTAVIGTVHGDLHDIGKNLVKIMLEGRGIQVVDLGVDVTAEQFISAAVEKGAGLVCCSALLTTTMGEMQQVVELRDSKGLKDKIKVMIGGAPITQSFCDSIGADAYAADAATGAEVALTLLTA